MSEPLAILIVEDEPDFRSEFERIIAMASDMHVVGSAGNVADGLALLKRAPVDVLLVDLGLPDGSGLTLIRDAVQRWPERCDVMVVSVFADMTHVLSAIEAGATGYLLKDSSPASFVEQIRDLHAGGSPISPTIARQLLRRLTPAVATALAKPASCCITLADSERAVLNYAARGYTYDEVAELMGITRHTVMSYVKRCYRKLQVHSKSEALYEARRLGLVEE